jgi:hypothetical protein
VSEFLQPFPESCILNPEYASPNARLFGCACGLPTGRRPCGRTTVQDSGIRMGVKSKNLLTKALEKFFYIYVIYINSLIQFNSDTLK